MSYRRYSEGEFVSDAYETPAWEALPPPRRVGESYEYSESYVNPRRDPCERVEQYSQYSREERKNHQRDEHMGELGAVAAGAFAMYESHKAKVDTEHASRHKHEAEIAEVAALGSGGYAVYEHHEKKKIGHNMW